MSVGEGARRHLRERLDEAIGAEATDTLMGEFTAIRGELTELRQEIDGLRTEMRVGFAELRGELRAELHHEIGVTRGEIAELAQQMAQQTRQLGVWMLGAMTTLAGLAFGAASLT